MTRVKRMALVETPELAPYCEFLVRGHRSDDTGIWQVPSVATLRATSGTHTAGLRNRNLELVKHRALKQLGGGDIEFGSEAMLRKTWLHPQGRYCADPGMLFSVHPSMRSGDNMRSASQDIEDREDAARWLATRRKRRRRVLPAFRFLLTEPKRLAVFGGADRIAACGVDGEYG